MLILHFNLFLCYNLIYSKKVDVMLDKLLFGKNYPIYKVEEINDKII